MNGDELGADGGMLDLAPSGELLPCQIVTFELPCRVARCYQWITKCSASAASMHSEAKLNFFYYYFSPSQSCVGLIFRLLLALG